MNAPTMNTPLTALEYYNLIRERIEHEDNLIVQRLTWLVGSQSFLFTAYAIASNYLRKSGAVSDTLATNDQLLGLIVEMFHRGERNKIRLANRAIAKFEAHESA